MVTGMNMKWQEATPNFGTLLQPEWGQSQREQESNVLVKLVTKAKVQVYSMTMLQLDIRE